MIADLLTIEEKFGRLKGINFVYMGDARNNLGNSLMVACAKMGLNFTACAPKELFPAEELVATCKAIAEENGCTITLTEDIEFSLKQIIRGRKLGWARDAIVYDEQPVGFKQSWSQRSRWTVGHIQCLKEYTVDLEKATLLCVTEKRSKEEIDKLVSTLVASNKTEQLLASLEV